MVMTPRNFILIILSCFAALFPLLSKGISTETRIFNPSFRTLKIGLEDNFMADPVLRLGTQDRITISFDELGEDNSFLEYRLIHCNADWQPSRLVESEYVEGFNSAPIDDYAFSSSTFVHYVNYKITIPNQDMRILHSGNYLLQVYNPDDAAETILQARFQISENSIGIRGSYGSRTDMGHNSKWQQLSLAVDTRGAATVNPWQDIIVTVKQNNSENTLRTLTTPTRTETSSAIYEHRPELIFNAGNEYRRFESTSNNFPGLHVDSLRFGGTNYHVWLSPDSPRSHSQYSYDRTQHGRFLVREYNSTDSDIGADYITVHFTLDSPPIQQEIYIDGEFTHGIFDSSNRMAYDSSRNCYVAEIPVKQGAYNYRYAVIAPGAECNPDLSVIEGDKYETDNEYNVDVYLRLPGSRADRLAGHANIIQ